MYQTFVNSFAAEEASTGGGKLFVKGGAILPENQGVVTKSDSTDESEAQVQYYNPIKIKPSVPPPAATTTSSSKWESVSSDKATLEAPAIIVSADGTERKKRAIDDFMLELKQKQEERNKIKAAGGNPDALDGPGPSSSSDSAFAGFIDDNRTSNIHVGDLDLSVRILQCYKLFFLLI